MMGTDSAISWCDHTFNPVIGCQHVSPGCYNCYAEDQNNHRKWVAAWGPHGERRRTSATTWAKPMQYQRGAATFLREHGRRQRVFCASLSDWLDNQWEPNDREDLLNLIYDTPDLDWLMLTKRPENYQKLVGQKFFAGTPLPNNVWFGITAENQDNYERRWAIASQIPAAVHFVSYEPAIGPLIPGSDTGKSPDWIICGGESGPHRRYFHIEWAENCWMQCHLNGIAFFFKQDSALRSGQRGRASDELWNTKEFPR